MTNNEKLRKAEDLIFEVWEDVVPDRPDQDDFLQIIWTAERIVSDLQDFQTFIDGFDEHYQK